MSDHAKRQRQYRARMKQEFGEMYLKRERDRIARYRRSRKEKALICLLGAKSSDCSLQQNL